MCNSSKSELYPDFITPPSLIENVLLREEIRERLKDIYDIERIIGKLILETENGRDLIALKTSIKNSLEIYKLLKGNPLFEIEVKTLIEIYNMIEKAIVDEPPFSVSKISFPIILSIS